MAEQPTTAGAGSASTSEPPVSSSNGEPLPKKKKSNSKKKKKPQDVSLYELLEINWDATPEEIKKAYRKRALKLHPDKGGDPAQFHAMKRAYDVLSDESKRATYDTYGLEMLKVMEGEGGPEVFVMLLLKQRRFRALIMVFTLLFVGFLLLFPILASVKWDGADWSWGIVFIPVWLMLTIGYASQIQIIVRGPPIPDGEEPQPAENRPVSFVEIAFSTVMFACCVIFFAFFSARLDNTITWTWFAVIIPWLLLEVVVCIHRVLGAKEAVVEMRVQMQGVRAYHEREIEEARNSLELGDVDAALRIHEAEESIKKLDKELEDLGMSKVYLTVAFFWPLLRFITAFLIAGKADNSFDGSWFQVAIPFIIGTMIFPFLESIVALGSPETMPGEPCRICCMSGLQYYIVLLTWLLAMGKLDNPFIYSAFAVFAPWFAICAILLCYTTMFLCVNPEDLLQQQQGQQQQSGEAGSENGNEQQTGAAAAGATSAGAGAEPASPATTQNGDAPNVIILT